MKSKILNIILVFMSICFSVPFYCVLTDQKINEITQPTKVEITQPTKVDELCKLSKLPEGWSNYWYCL